MGTPTSCKNRHVRQSDIHLGEIEAIVVGENEGVSVVSCSRVDNWGGISHGYKETEEVNAGNHSGRVRGK
jgi:hypothetical protein